jgi:rhodanese-related sulfurtransferase
MVETVTLAALKEMLVNGDELALLDVREEGVFSQAHLLWASSVPLSRIELLIADLVPRRAARIVLCDGADGLADRAAARLGSFGYSSVAILDGGIDGWRAAGGELFSGVNVPSKAFGEFVEVTYHTPNITAEELKARIDAGEDMVVLDSRPFTEYHRMNIPTGIDVPGAELAYRVHDIAPSPDTLVVVNCAGRTRSIIGAQSLINAGIPNSVMALRNGTMGWELAGYEPERGQERRAPEVSGAGLDKAQTAAARVRGRFGVKTIDAETLETWRGEADTRTLYLFDVRDPEEYEAGHMPGSVSAPGGQLVQATDRYAATRGARIVLIDDTGVRATMTASWLIQMGWRDAVVLDGGLSGGEMESGRRDTPILGLGDAEPVDPETLERWLAAGDARVIDLGRSLDYRAGHVPGAWFAVRSRLAAALERVPGSGRLVFTSDDGRLARLAASERGAAYLDGGTAAWAASGRALTDGEENMADVADDMWLRPYDRAGGVEQAMNEYLAWEIDLVDQIERDGTARFRAYPN